MYIHERELHILAFAGVTGYKACVLILYWIFQGARQQAWTEIVNIGSAVIRTQTERRPPITQNAKGNRVPSLLSTSQGRNCRVWSKT
jgi:hypothetical protein